MLSRSEQSETCAFSRPELQVRLSRGRNPGLQQVSGNASIYARALAAVIADTAEPVTLAGWSTGAMVALETAAAYPANIDRLILFSATPKFCAEDAWEHGIPAANVRAMIAGLRRDPEATLGGFFKLAARPGRLTAAEYEGKIAVALRQGEKNLADQLRYLMTTDLRAAVRKITIPVTLIHGNKDAIIPRAASAWLADELPDSRLISLPGKGHTL
ncbi:MAG: alpha/beta hydrolase [Lentisphaeria bacterium]|nr:alpha/beta hydrolase [Lentisphaeria bacterium]